MILLHMAHRGEAQHFITHLGAKASQTDLPGVYINKEIIILIAGEGLTNSHNKISYLLGKYPISEVINLGIAGVLDKSIKLDQIVAIETSYAFTHKVHFHSFISSLKGLSCISTDERVLTLEYAQKIAPFAPIVDRELWAVASACSLFAIPFKSFKYLSDYAGVNSACLDIKKRADEFSQKLLEHYLSFKTDTHSKNDEIKIPSDFYLSFTQKQQVLKLLKVLSTKWDMNASDVLENLNIKELQASDLRPKDKTTRLIQILENAINPLRKVIKEKLHHSVFPILEAGAQVQFDRQLEKKEFQIRMNINSQTNLEKLKKAIHNFEFQDFCDVMDGKLDV